MPFCVTDFASERFRGGRFAGYEDGPFHCSAFVGDEIFIVRSHVCIVYRKNVFVSKYFRSVFNCVPVCGGVIQSKCHSC